MKHLTLMALALAGVMRTEACGDPDPTPTPPPAADELCDAEDNNGDGTVDEGYSSRVVSISLAVDLAKSQATATYGTCGTGTLQLDVSGLTIVSASIPYTASGSALTLTPPPGAPFSIAYGFVLDGAYDTTGWYGTSSHGGTFLWPYNGYQVLPFPTGQDWPIDLQVSVTGAPSGTTVLAPLSIRQANPYQLSMTFDRFSPTVELGRSQQGTVARWHGRVDDGATAQESRDRVLSYLDFYESELGLYPWTALEPVSAKWCADGSTCDYGGMEEHPLPKLSADNLSKADKVGVLTSSLYYSGLTVTAHEIAHAWGPGGLAVRPECIGDLLPFNEGGVTWISGVARAETDAIHTEAEYRAYYLSEVQSAIARNRDKVVWPATCSEAAGSTPSNYSTLAYMRGALFWDGVDQVVGRAPLLAWWEDLTYRARKEPAAYTYTGLELLDDLTAFTGVDPRGVLVTMSDGSNSNLVDGWLKTAGAYPTTQP
jgi:hypothetical protein